MSQFHIIEDDGFVRETLESFLEYTPHSCLSFFSGDEYLSYLDSPEYENPDAVLSDIRMPGTDGHTLVRMIRNKHPQQRIALISGYVTSEAVSEVADQLCYVMKKPFHPKELEWLIGSLAKCADKASQGCEYEAFCHSGIEHSCPNHST